jgi:DNA-directed RNA polymerase subunit E"
MWFGGYYMSTRRKSIPFKACVSCRALVDKDAEVCPYCGSKEFTSDWSGVLIVIEPENSELAKTLGVSGKGRYAVKIE